ncbi:MAG: hypothetical protein K2M97_04615 [Muribaculaceae bacterium]|nr:hypothetical protein [Muribaculaceae bacterium]
MKISSSCKISASALTLAVAAAALTATTSCDPISGEQELENYTHCVSVVTDNYTGNIFVDTGSSYKVKGDILNSTFTVECNNVRFEEGAPALSAKVAGLNQYYNADSTYVFMLQHEFYSSSSGQFQPDSLRYAKYGCIWIPYFAVESCAPGRHYSVMLLPPEYIVRTDSMMVYRANPNGSIGYTILNGNALGIQYDLKLNPENRTMDMKVNGQKFVIDGKPQQYYLRNVGITYTTTGYIMHSDRAEAYDLKGNRLPELDAYNLSGEMTTAPVGVRYMKYYLNSDKVSADQEPDLNRMVYATFYNYTMSEQ